MVEIYGSPERWARSIRKQVTVDGQMTETMRILYRAVVHPRTDADRLALSRLLKQRLDRSNDDE